MFAEEQISGLSFSLVIAFIKVNKVSGDLTFAEVEFKKYPTLTSRRRVTVCYMGLSSIPIKLMPCFVN